MVGAPTIVIALLRMIRAPTLVAHLSTIRSGRRDNAAGRQQQKPNSDYPHGEVTQRFHWRSPKVVDGIERTLFRSAAEHSGRSVGGVSAALKNASRLRIVPQVRQFLRAAVRRSQNSAHPILQLLSSTGVAVACARIRTHGVATHWRLREALQSNRRRVSLFRAKPAGPAVQSRAKARQNRGTAPSL
jgi:hypothetical protein